jgi:hypothetical protein
VSKQNVGINYKTVFENFNGAKFTNEVPRVKLTVTQDSPHVTMSQQMMSAAPKKMLATTISRKQNMRSAVAKATIAAQPMYVVRKGERISANGKHNV